MHPEGASEPAVGVSSVADEFNLDYPLGLEDRIHNTVIPLNSDAVATRCTLEFLHPCGKASSLRPVNIRKARCRMFSGSLATSCSTALRYLISHVMAEFTEQFLYRVGRLVASGIADQI